MAIRRQATAGMVADTSLYNIDGACVTAAGAVVRVGRAVGVVGNGAELDYQHKVVGFPITEGNALGVAVRSSYESPLGTYGGAASSVDNRSPINVMTAGRIWMETEIAAGDLPAFGTALSVVAATGMAALTGIATTWTFAGGYQPADSVSGESALIEVQVKQK